MANFLILSHSNVSHDDRHSICGDRPRPGTFRAGQRVLLAVLGVSLLGTLAAAAYFQPDPRGFGTHQQLGLPPCSFRTIFGIRCPSCGMTTSWAHFVRGNLRGALRANAGGTLLAVIVLAAGAYLTVSGVRGRWLIGPPNEWLVAAAATAFVLLAMLDWLFRWLLS